MKTTYIYGLYAKENNIRYIGKTDNLNKRLYEHILNSKHKKTHKDIWIQKELNNGNEIKIILLEEVLFDLWKDAEIKWIENFKDNNLTNHAKGGMGGRGEFYKISYEELKLWVKNNLKCDSKQKWENLAKNKMLPSFIPKSPREKYKNNGWLGWGDFLGTGKIQDNSIINNYVSYEEAKKIIKTTFTIKTLIEWKKIVKQNLIPKEIPNRPERFYKNRGWNSWGDFLSTNRIANQNKKFISYLETIKWIKNNDIKLNSIEDWRNFCKTNKPQFIPSNPSKEYNNNGWENWGTFLGTNRISDKLIHKNYINFEEVVKIASELKLKSLNEWKIWHKNNNPKNIPLNPDISYKMQWKGWRFFLGKSLKKI